MNKTKLLVLLTVFIDVIGIGIIIPVLPFYVEGFGASAFVVTALFAVYSFCSLLSAPVIGVLSDKYGRRPMLIVSILSTSVGWFVFAAAPSILFLFIGRIIDGLAAGNLPIAQSYFSDLAKDEKERTHNLGLIGMIFGVAFIIGPFLGGVLGAISHSFPFWFAGGLALFNAILALFLLPETHHIRSERKVSINPFVPLGRAVRNIDLRSNYLAWFLFGIAIASYQSIFTLFVNKAFGLTESSVGLIFAATGVVIALNQGVAMKHFWLKKFREPELELWSLPIYGIGFVLLSFRNLPIFVLGLIVTTFGQAILRVVMTSQIAAKAKPAERGEAMGVLSSVTSLSMVLGPLIGGILFGFNMNYPFWSGGFFLLLAFVVIYNLRKKLVFQELPEDVEMNSEI
jgi:MFS transporter, DHA1 family, tetracycline resistance protein